MWRSGPFADMARSLIMHVIRYPAEPPQYFRTTSGRSATENMSGAAGSLHLPRGLIHPEVKQSMLGWKHQCQKSSRRYENHPSQPGSALPVSSRHILQHVPAALAKPLLAAAQACIVDVCVADVDDIDVDVDVDVDVSYGVGVTTTATTLPGYGLVVPVCPGFVFALGV